MSGRPATMFRPEIINQPRVLEFLRYLFTRWREIDEHDAQHAGAKEGFRDSMRLINRVSFVCVASVSIKR